MSATPAAVARSLREMLGADGVLDDPQAAARYGTDRTALAPPIRSAWRSRALPGRCARSSVSRAVHAGLWCPREGAPD